MKPSREVRTRRCALNAVLFLSLLYSSGAMAQSSPATIKQLSVFGCDSSTNICPDGQNPNWLIQSADGNFYGTTSTGGVGKAGGTVFKISPAGNLSVVFTFVADTQGNSPDGSFPSSLVEGNDGSLYGTTLEGGAHNVGVIFKLTKAGKIQVLHSFCDSCGESAEPSHLILATDGKFYGATEGTVFRITSAGSFTNLQTFSAYQPPLGIVQASDGNLYGTTIGGRTLLTPLFRLSQSAQFLLLHTFHYPDFASSVSIQGADGKLYGNSTLGLFKSNLDGSGFQEFPIAGYAGLAVTQASDLTLWSPAFYESNATNGVINQISTKGSLLQTIAFDGANGTNPSSPLVQGSDGKLYGVTNTGGTVAQGETANGVVFALDAGLVPPKPAIVGFNPSSGVAGTKVMIHGSHFVGTKAVSFNAVSAAFQVLNTGNILATVPAGATTGSIAVTNPGGTVKSQKSFSVP